jgi:hypothetical protein
LVQVCRAHGRDKVEHPRKFLCHCLYS